MQRGDRADAAAASQRDGIKTAENGTYGKQILQRLPLKLWAQIRIGFQAETLPGLRGKKVLLIPALARQRLLQVKAEDRLAHAAAFGDQTIAEKAAAGQHREAWVQRDITVVARPDRVNATVAVADIDDFIPGKPGTAAADKLPLELGVQAHPRHRRRQRRQQAQRAGAAAATGTGDRRRGQSRRA